MYTITSLSFYNVVGKMETWLQSYVNICANIIYTTAEWDELSSYLCIVKKDKLFALRLNELNTHKFWIKVDHLI